MNYQLAGCGLVPASLRGERLALAIAQQQLRDLQRHVDELQAENRRLMAALAEASVRGSEAHRRARQDELTGLPNRLSFTEQMQQTLADAGRRRQQFAVLFIDLDGFKAVNDCCGHIVGDRLLMTTAARIASCIRVGDIACRYGGDEFVVLLSRVQDVAVAAAIAEKNPRASLRALRHRRS